LGKGAPNKSFVNGYEKIGFYIDYKMDVLHQYVNYDDCGHTYNIRY
jgi:hypothetical protein